MQLPSIGTTRILLESSGGAVATTIRSRLIAQCTPLLVTGLLLRHCRMFAVIKTVEIVLKTVWLAPNTPRGPHLKTHLHSTSTAYLVVVFSSSRAG